MRWCCRNAWQRISKAKKDGTSIPKNNYGIIAILARQGIPIREKEDGNDDFTQLLLLRGKDHPFIIERLTSRREHSSSYVHHNYQNDLINIMSKQLLRKKLYDVNRSRMFSLMCDEYTDVFNKQQLSIKLLWTSKYSKWYHCQCYQRFFDPFQPSTVWLERPNLWQCKHYAWEKIWCGCSNKKSST